MPSFALAWSTSVSALSLIPRINKYKYLLKSVSLVFKTPSPPTIFSYFMNKFDP